MHIGKRFTAIDYFKWTLKNAITLLLVSFVPTCLYAMGFHFIAIPWQPIAVLGTALAFIVGFKNNASYDRIWEARKIYGSIINNSRSFGYTLRDALGSTHTEQVRIMFNRHFAWLTALRYQLREPKSWENIKNKKSSEFLFYEYSIAEWETPIEEELRRYLSAPELHYILSKKNKTAQITALQSESLAALKKEGVIDSFQWLALQKAITRLTDDQGKAERIKNFPYPRNFVSVATYLMFTFVLLAPFGLLRQMDAIGRGTIMEGYTIWMTIPIAAMVSWAFNTLIKTGESSVNPFEGSVNDVPITQISRAIEIDMLDMLDETDLPVPIKAVHDIVL